MISQSLGAGNSDLAPCCLTLVALETVKQDSTGPSVLYHACLQNQWHMLPSSAASLVCNLISLGHYSVTVCWSPGKHFPRWIFFIICLVENPSSSIISLDFTLKWICNFYKMFSQSRSKFFSLMVLISSTITAALNLALPVTSHLKKGECLLCDGVA